MRGFDESALAQILILELPKDALPSLSLKSDDEFFAFAKEAVRKRLISIDLRDVLPPLGTGTASSQADRRVEGFSGYNSSN